MEVFDEQMKLIKDLGYEFYDPKFFLDKFNEPKNNKKILITIDDGFTSFYNEAWPYLKKMIFHLFCLSPLSRSEKMDI